MKSHNIKNILEERRIDVSENSWEKLAGQLDANDQKKKRKSFYPYAACFALLVGFSVFMMLKTADAIGTETIVETEKEATKIPTQVDSKEKIISLETEKFSIKNNTVVTQEETLKSIESKDITTSATIEKATESEIELLKEVQNTVVVNTKEKSLKEI